MNRLKFIIPKLLLILFLSFPLFPVEKEVWKGDENLIFEIFYRELCPGEALLITTKNSNISSAEAWIFQKKFPFYKGKNNNTLFALIGIDLFTKPGLYCLTLKVKTNSETFEIKKFIKIKEKYFPLKKIHVEEKYVIPPPEVLNRIKREREILDKVFKTLTPQYLFEKEFICPLPAEGKRNFGERRIFNLKKESRHTGVDIPAPLGENVKASNKGKIVLARDLYYAGKTVIIDHGFGLFSVYCHLSQINVREGELVSKGYVIGKVGATGRVTGPHLHWGFKLNGARIDPYSILELPLKTLD